MRLWRAALVAAMIVSVAASATPENSTATPEEVATTEQEAVPIQPLPKSEKNDVMWLKLLSCFVQDDANDCFEKQTYKVVKSWINSARRTKSKGLLKQKEKPEKDKGIMDHLGDILTYGVSRFLSYVEEDDEEEDEDAERKVEAVEKEVGEEFSRAMEEAEKEQREPVFLNYLNKHLIEFKNLVGRKKKKGKLKRLIAAIKLLVLGAVAKAKITLILDKLGFLLKLKFFVVAFLHLLIALAKLYLEWSRHKTPQKVIYYEHAQHQHHYDTEHHHDDAGWFGGGNDDKKGGWLGSLWSRSNDEPSNKKIISYPQSTSQAHYPQDMAYSAYRPQDYSQQYPVYRSSTS